MPRLVLLALALACAAPATAQSGSLPTLPPLDAVLSAAHRQSPAIRYADATVAKNAAYLDRTRSAWTDNFGINVGATAGSYGNELVDQLAVGATVGVNVRVSLYDVLGRRHEARQAEAQLAQAEARRAEADEELDLVVIALYRKTELAYRLVGVRSGGMESARTHRLMAEAEFVQGDVAVGELARVDQIAAEAQAAYETARTDYLTAYGQLDRLAGGALSTLTASLAETDSPSAR
ncbi:MAG: TolC family protein [Bacteroidota bacterium]